MGRRITNESSENDCKSSVRAISVLKHVGLNTNIQGGEIYINETNGSHEDMCNGEGCLFMGHLFSHWAFICLDQCE